MHRVYRQNHFYVFHATWSHFINVVSKQDNNLNPFVVRTDIIIKTSRILIHFLQQISEVCLFQ